jgi:hypothetical protein
MAKEKHSLSHTLNEVHIEILAILKEVTVILRLYTEQSQLALARGETNRQAPEVDCRHLDEEMRVLFERIDSRTKTLEHALVKFQSRASYKKPQVVTFRLH